MKNLFTLIAFIIAITSAFAQPSRIPIEDNHKKTKQYIMISNNGKELLSNKTHTNLATDNRVKGTYNEYLITDFTDAVEQHITDNLTASDTMQVLLDDVYNYADSIATVSGINHVLSISQSLSADRAINTGGHILTITGNQTISGNAIISGTALISGASTFTKLATNTSTSTSLTITSSQYGSTLFWSPGGTATATLPANGAAAGSWFDVIILTDQTTTISAATADTLITDGDTAADSVAFSTSSHKIGSCVRFISNGSVWIAINLGNTTMTIAS